MSEERKLTNKQVFRYCKKWVFQFSLQISECTDKLIEFEKRLIKLEEKK